MATRKSRPKPVHQMTEGQFEAMFPVGDEDACKTYLMRRRWPQGVVCPRCAAVKVFPVSTMPFKWQCYQCAPDQGYRFSVIAGTIFENTNKPLRQWFKVVHLMTTSKKGISSLQIQRQMGFGSYETALNMTHKIRAAMMQPEQKLGGIVEVDETYVGGKDYWRHWDKKSGGRGGEGSGKTPVIGAAQRKGNVIARVLDSVTAKSAGAFVREVVSDKVSLLATDDYQVYDNLHEYPRETVKHRQDQYVRHLDPSKGVVGAVHTNTIEGFWSIFKRGVVGTFHKVSAKYLPLYVAEFQFRYNNRFNDDIFGATISGC
jgi:ISXO2-like transposase domain/Transposase zinc-ribbon domain